MPHVLFDIVIMPNQVFLLTGHSVVTVKLAGKLWHITVQMLLASYSVGAKASG
jgi:hypothetical protein